jgi:hypothetical protein
VRFCFCNISKWIQHAALLPPDYKKAVSAAGEINAAKITRRCDSTYRLFYSTVKVAIMNLKQAYIDA